jgi:hypothetical protein
MEKGIVKEPTKIEINPFLISISYTHLLLYSAENKMIHTFERDAYTVLLSQNDRVIFIKLTDNINYVSYEGNVEQKELQLQLELADIYQIIHKCFTREPEYDVAISVQSNQTMQLRFSAVVGGFLKLKFAAMLREKLMSNDGQLTTQFHRMEQKYGSLLKRLEELENKCAERQAENMELMERIGCAEVYLGDLYSSHSVVDLSLFKNINASDIKITAAYTNTHAGNIRVAINPTKIKAFYNLTSLNICGIRYEHGDIQFENNTLKKLILETATSISSLRGLNKLPNLTSLTVTGAASLTNVPAVLSSYKHNIKELTFKGCTGINVVELQTYCQTNGITLNIS